MKTQLIAATALILAFGITAPAIAASCQLSNKAKPGMSFATTAAAPRTWKTGDVPGKLTRALNRMASRKGRDTADTTHPLDGINIICNDWIVICANDDCTHGVVECDGDCIDY